MASPISSIASSPVSNASLNHADIASVYAQLQSAVESTTARTASRSSTFELSPPETPGSAKDVADGDCPCQQHVLKNTDSSGICSICNRVIPVAEEEKHKFLVGTQSALEAAERRVADLEAQHAALLRAVREKDDLVSSLQHDMAVLNEKYVSEIEKAVEIQHGKNLVERELENLSQQLFEEANGMVAVEKKAKYHLELQHKRLLKELENARDRIAVQDMQLQALRKIIQQQEEEEEEQQQQQDPTADEEDSAHPKTIAGIDTMLLNEFKSFVRQSMVLPLKKLSSLPFLRPCLEEDILPCLRFGPNSRMSSRKLVDAILFNACFIEETPAGGDAGLFVGCQACGRPPDDPTAPLAYRVRTSYYDDWACIDRFCRDRLVAVCEFYTFIRNVHQGYYTARSVSDLYHEAMRLRLQMFYAR
ncbi:hypothetical protein BX666DRAFT_1847425 [Dichotomocladium elegans]|nr:hypothetical protein BX666DRAFT_1847425 [Dichotomocladium elegans]